MDLSRFYELIDDARDSRDPVAPSADPADLRDVLTDLPDDDLLEFLAAFEREVERLNRWEVWGAGYVLDGGMSDDGFEYFRYWLIGKGRDVVEAVLTDADGLVEVIDDVDADEFGFENEELGYVAVELLDERGVEIPESEVDSGAPEGDEWDEDTVGERYPRISAWLAARED